jgi:hypothetical protein
MNNAIEICKNKTTVDYSQRDIFLSYGLLFQCACIINVTTQHVVLVHSGHHYRFIECNLFSP